MAKKKTSKAKAKSDTNSNLKAAAITAIANYHADTSVSMRATRDGLLDIINEAQLLVDACEADLGPDGED